MREIKRQVMWAWWDEKTHEFCHIYRRKFLVEMCSPDGFRGRIKRGEGKIVKVLVREDACSLENEVLG